MARCSQAILGPLLGVIQDMYLNDSHNGREGVLGSTHSPGPTQGASLAEIGFLTWLITFNTKITHLGDALAALGNYRDAITCHVNGT
jgi:hypothetical protein